MLHKAYPIVIGLQKDLNLYLVNVFDISVAAGELGLKRPFEQGLPYLLKNFCEVHFVEDVRFQSSYCDWRKR